VAVIHSPAEIVVADDSHKVPMSARLGPQNAEAVFLIVEGDALDEACQRFMGRRCLGWLHTGVLGFVSLRSGVRRT
jgi:hypothetical protein